MIKPEEVYRIGRIGKPHGVRGEVSMQFTNDIFDRADADYVILRVDGILVPFFIEEYRFRSDSVALLKLCDIDTQEQARSLTGCEVYFPWRLTDQNDEELSWTQLVGFRLLDARTRQAVGQITHIDDTTLNTLFEVRTDDGRELLVPAPEELITDISIPQREIYMELPDGILELDT